MGRSELPFEEANVEGYRLLLRIEVALRELLARELEQQLGPRWRNRLPGEVLQRIRESEREEEKRRQFDFLRLGPLYYLDFGQLLQIIQQQAGRSVVARLGGDTFVEQLKSLFAVRNAIAHARGASQSGLELACAVYGQMESALTSEGLRRLLSTPDIGVRPGEVAPELSVWLATAHEAMVALSAEVGESPCYARAVHQYWWGHAELAGFDCAAVETAFGLAGEYDSLPKGVGSAAMRRRFYEDRRVRQVFETAVNALEAADG